MAWDLWCSSYDQVACDGNYSEHAEWKCDFYFGSGRDVIEEDALNEESCVQVLRILVTKADTEIQELEKDLLSLQNELACAENEKWPEVCCSALSARINWLDVAISTLKNDNADDMELLDNKPADTLHEIVKALQREYCQDADGQLLDVNILNLIVNDTNHVLDNDSSSIDSNIIIKEEGKELCGASENSRSSELLFELRGKSSDDNEKIEELLAKSLVTSPDLGTISCGPDHSDETELSGTLDDKITENEEVGRSQLVTTDTGQILNFFSSMGNGNIPREAKKENAVVREKDVSSDDFTLAAGVKGRKKCLHSTLGASELRKSGNSDLDKKLCDFAPKTARRACKKESKVATAENLDSNLPLQVVYPQGLCLADIELCSIKGTNGNNSPQMMNIKDTNLVDAENSGLFSLLEMQTKNALYTGLQLTDEEKHQAEDLKSKIAANLSKSDVSFPSKLKAPGKRKLEIETLSARETHESPAEVNPNTSIIVSTKRQRKSKTSYGDASLNESMNSKVTNRAMQPGQHETESQAIVLYDRNFSESQKKRRVSKLPIIEGIQNSTVDLNIPNSGRVSMDSGSQVDLDISKLYNLVGSHDEASPLLPNTLKKLSLTNLRAIAKQCNVTKYYKLPKGALVEQLLERLSNSSTYC